MCRSGVIQLETTIKLAYKNKVYMVRQASGYKANAVHQGTTAHHLNALSLFISM